MQGDWFVLIIYTYILNRILLETQCLDFFLLINLWQNLFKHIPENYVKVLIMSISLMHQYVKIVVNIINISNDVTLPSCLQVHVFIGFATDIEKYMTHLLIFH